MLAALTDSRLLLLVFDRQVCGRRGVYTGGEDDDEEAHGRGYPSETGRLGSACRRVSRRGQVRVCEHRRGILFKVSHL